jgi:predicted small secreted protein
MTFTGANPSWSEFVESSRSCPNSACPPSANFSKTERRTSGADSPTLTATAPRGYAPPSRSRRLVAILLSILYPPMKTALPALFLALAALAVLTLSSCSTAQGVGRDLQFLGRGLEKVAG